MCLFSLLFLLEKWDMYMTDLAGFESCKQGTTCFPRLLTRIFADNKPWLLTKPYNHHFTPYLFGQLVETTNCNVLSSPQHTKEYMPLCWKKINAKNYCVSWCCIFLFSSDLWRNNFAIFRLSQSCKQGNGKFSSGIYAIRNNQRKTILAKRPVNCCVTSSSWGIFTLNIFK